MGGLGGHWSVWRWGVLDEYAFLGLFVDEVALEVRTEDFRCQRLFARCS